MKYARGPSFIVSLMLLFFDVLKRKEVFHLKEENSPRKGDSHLTWDLSKLKTSGSVLCIKELRDSLS